jgi:hypothetical protein
MTKSRNTLLLTPANNTNIIANPLWRVNAGLPKIALRQKCANLSQTEHKSLAVNY